MGNRSGMNFEFDERAFRKAFKGAVQEGLQEIAQDLQARFDSVYETHHGRPAEEVLARLVEMMPDDASKDPEEWRKYAEAISAGHQIKLELGEPIW